MKWTTVKNLGSIKYFNISYVVLLLVPITVNICEAVNEKFNYDWSVPITIKALYFASIAFAIAIAIYQYKCPELIKKFDNGSEHIKTNIEQFKNRAPDLKLNIVLTNINMDTQAETFNEIMDLVGKIEEASDPKTKVKIKSQLNKKLESVYHSSVQNFLQEQFDSANQKNPFACWFSATLYLIGSGIIFGLLILRTIMVINS